MTKLAIKLFMIILLCASGTIQLCAKGCLKCNQNNQCILCDYTQAYQLIDNQCQKQESTNCEVFSTDGFCLTCLPDYYLDSGDTKKCIKVSTLLTNCQYYSSATTCMGCKPGYFIQGAECKPVTTTVTNCAEYQSESTCVKCNSGQLIDVEGKNCRSITTVANCQRHSNVKCLACDSTTFLQSNHIWHNLQFFMTEDPTGKFSFNAYQIKKQALENKCRRIQVDNCKELETYYKCKVCNTGYFLKNGICVLNPIEIIPNCQVYLFADQCLKCSNGYLRQNSKTCVPVKPIYKCNIYDGTKDTTVCSECDEFYYLKDFNYCDQRRNEIASCKVYHIDQDGCLRCDTGLITTTDSLKCLPQIQDCKSYLTSSYQQEALKCGQCVDEFFTLDGSKCEKGSIAFCLEYGNDKQECKKCANKYYLDADGLCKPHDETPHCQTYHPLFKNVCTQCDTLSFLFDVQAVCSAITVQNCAQYLTPTSCKVCQDGYHLKKNDQNQQICEVLNPAELPNCLNASLGVCLKCQPNFNLVLGQCQSPFEALLDQCQESNLDGTTASNSFQCLKCKQGTVPFNHNNLFLCVKDKKVEEITGISQTNSNCLQYYEQSKGVFKCTKCAENFVLQDDGSCSSTQNACNNQTDNFYHQFVRERNGEVQFYWRDYCQPKSDDLCYAFGISNKNTQLNQVNYVCSQCRAVDGKNVLRTIKVDEEESALITGKGPEFSNDNQSYWKTKFSCEVQDGNNDVKLKGTYDNNCEYYQKLHLDQYGCMRCKAGFKGTTVGWQVENCDKYDDKKNCISCIPAYYLENGVCTFKDSSSSTVTPDFIKNCEQYSFDQNRCYQCKDTHYLDIKDDNTTACLLRVQVNITDCTHYSPVSDKCVKCKDNYTLLMDTDNKQICQLNSDNCLQMETKFKCLTCKQAFYLDGSTCKASVDTNCFLWETNKNNCLIFKKIPFVKTYDCTKATLVANCQVYNATTGVCTQCAADHYLYTKAAAVSCVKHNHKPDGTADTDDCKIYAWVTDKDVCQECKTGYHEEDKLPTGKICVQDNFFYIRLDSNDVKLQDIDYSYIETDVTKSLLAKVSVYDFQRKEPVICDDGYYLYKSNCCLVTKFGDTCATNVTTIVASCDKLQYDAASNINTCISCVGALILTNGRCCTAGQFWATDGECRAPPTNCEVGQFDEVLQYCYQCKVGFYNIIDSNSCVAKGNFYVSPISAPLISTKQIATIVQNQCNVYIDAMIHCLECKPSSIFDESRIQCVPILNKITNCQQVDQLTKKCLKCNDGFDLQSGLCCSYKSTPPQVFFAADQACADVTTTVANCISYSTKATCQKCATGFFLKTNTSCLPYENATATLTVSQVSNKCAYYDFQISTITADQSCFFCHYDDNGVMNYRLGTDLCCPATKKFVIATQTCDDIGIGNCILRDGTDADKCGDCTQGNVLKADKTGCDAVANSINPELIADTECKYGFYYDVAAKACVAYQEAAQFGFKNNRWCKKIADNGTAALCPECVASHTKNSTVANSPCVKFGYYWSTLQQLPLSLDHCQSINNVLNECDECQINQKLKMNHSTKVRILPGRYATNDFTYTTGTNKFKVIKNYHPLEYQLVDKQCCKFGWYFNSTLKKCVQNPIENCLEYDQTADTCTTCNTQYAVITLMSGKKVCCYTGTSYDPYLQKCVDPKCDGATQYLSNGHCCDDASYFNLENQQCEAITIPNCIRASNIYTCDKCDTTDPNVYYKDRHSAYLVNYFYGLGAGAFSEFDYKTQISHCVLDDATNAAAANNVTRWQLRNVVNNCLDFGDKSSCAVCKAGHYLTVHKVCCPLGQTSRKIDDSYKCVSIPDLAKNCFDFDWNTQTCIRCNLDPQSDTNLYHEQSGFCCPRNFYFNFNTMECDINNEVLRCQNFDVITGNCLKCQSGYYFSQGNCCAEGTYYKTDSCQAMESALGQDNCLIWVDAGFCVKCKEKNSSSNDLYLHRGRCVEVGKYINLKFNTVDIDDAVADADDFIATKITLAAPVQRYYIGGFTGCQKLDDLYYCVQCAPNYNLYNGRCCPNGHIINIKDAETFECSDLRTQSDVPDNCLVFDGIVDSILSTKNATADAADILNFQCRTCKANFYLGDDKVCCQEKHMSLRAVAGDYKTKNIFDCINNEGLIGCLQLSDDAGDSCSLCKEGYYQLAGTKTTCVLNTLPAEALSNLCKLWYLNGSNELSCQKCRESYQTKKITVGSTSYNICDTTKKVDNCIVYDNQTSTCTQCSLDYKWSTTPDPDACVKITPALPSNCETRNGDDCSKCKSGYILDEKTKTCLPRGPELAAANCLKGSYDATTGGLKCLECVSSFYRKTADNTCVAIGDAIGHQMQCMILEDDICLKTYSDFFIQTKSALVKIAVPKNFQHTAGPYILEEINKFRIEGCLHYKNPFECVKCDTGFNLSNKQCCKDGFWFNNSACVSYVNITPTLRCKKFINGSLCADEGCLDNQYVSNQKCCPDNKYFDKKQNACVNIPLISQPCKKHSNGKCLECVDTTQNYLSNGVCVRHNYYWDAVFQMEIDANSSNSKFPKCKQVSNDECQVCQQVKGDNSFSSSKCCTDANSTSQTYRQYYDFTNKMCVNLPKDDCKSFNFVTSTCTECPINPTKYLVDQTKCCQLGYYWKDDKCVLIKDNLDPVLYPFKDYCQELKTEDLLLFRCSGCRDGGVKRGNLCCQPPSQGDVLDVGNVCVQTSLMQNCQKLGTNGSCTECKTGYVLTGASRQVCCPTGNYFNPTTAGCSANPTTITQCSIYEDASNCSVCNTGYYLSSNKKKCCAVGTFFDGTNCASEVTVKNCVKFTSSTKCEQCLDNHYLIDASTATYCCPNSQYYDKVNEMCSTLASFTENCALMNDVRLATHFLSCSQCATGYLSNNHCCADNKFWDKETKQCKDTNNECKQINLGKCLTCKNDATHYLTNGMCCPLDQYYNGTACVAGQQDTKCQKYQDCNGTNCTDSQKGTLCSKCKTGFNLYEGKYCCANLEYWDTATSKCLEYNQTNRGDNYHPALSTCWHFSSDFNCLKCKETAVSTQLSVHKDACCKNHEFVQTTDGKRSCVSKVKVPTGCKIYFENILECQECLTGHYFSISPATHHEKHCCPHGQYYDVVSNLCKAISVFPNVKFQSECTQINVALKQCADCQSGWLLNSDKKCVQVPSGCNKDKFHKDTKVCYGCVSGHYMTHGVCCAHGKFYRMGMCIDIDPNLDVTGCLTAEGDKCLSCESGKYLTHNKCCKETQFYQLDANDQSVKHCKDRETGNHCKRFGFLSNECLECDDGYVLSSLEDEYYKCIQITERENCKAFTLTENNSNQNVLGCSACDNTTQPAESIYLLKAKNATAYNQELAVQGCSQLDFQNLLSKSSMKCIDQVTTTCTNKQFINDLGVCEDIPIKNCVSYDSKLDICYQCETDYFLKNYEFKSIHRNSCGQWNRSKFIHPPAGTLGYVSQCTADANQSTEAVENLPAELDKYFNVHHCKEEGKIPFAFVSAGGQTTFPVGVSRYNLKAPLDKPFSYRKTLPQDDSSVYSTSSNNLCMQPNLDLVENKPQDGTLIDNCAMAMVNTDKPLSFKHNNEEVSDLSLLSVFCVACQHGYKAMINPRLPLHAYKCVKIENCNTTVKKNFVNGCVNCNANFTFGFKEGVDYTQCLESKDEDNCLSIDSTKKCHYCKPGFSLNHLNKCEKLQSFKCTDSSVSTYRSYSTYDIGFVHRHYPSTPGCQKCADGYRGLFIDYNLFVCLGSPMLTNNQHYDQNCDRFGILNNSVVCSQCKDGYVKDVSGQCLQQSLSQSLSNCLLAEKTTDNNYKCLTCAEKFINVNYVCQTPSITNCAEYSKEISAQQVCNRCEDGYYNSNNKCLKGNVLNCRNYAETGLCSKCNSGYALTNLKDGQVVCVEVNLDQNCDEYSNNQFQDRNVSCTKCKTGFLLEVFARPKNTCSSFNEISDCIKYDKNDSLETSSLKCLQCKELFYLDNNQCKERKIIQNCLTYDINANRCTLCSTMHYLSKDQTQCISVPSGILNCLEYIDEKTCRQCKQDYYLFDNQCLLVSQKIANCILYADSVTCLQCQSDYFLRENLCRKITVTCVAYASESECSICPNQQILFLEEGKKVCKAFTAINQCTVHNNIDPVKCLTCNANHYLENNECKAVPNQSIIEGCQSYLNQDTCAVCQKGRALSLDKKKCVVKSFSNPATNCITLEENNPFCTYCEPGYILNDNGACEVDSKHIEGCMTVKEDSNQCDLCLPNYYMNLEQKCIPF